MPLDFDIDLEFELCHLDLLGKYLLTFFIKQ